MPRVRYRLWFILIPLMVVVAFLGYWGDEYSARSTPQKAQAAQSPTVGPFKTVRFGKGVVLLTPSSKGNSFTAWYMTKNFWGWHVTGVSNAAIGLSPQNYNVDFESFSFDGETFVWGTYCTPVKKILYHHNGKIYTAVNGTVWYMVLPFKQTAFPHDEWTLIRPDGKMAPLFKSSS